MGFANDIRDVTGPSHGTVQLNAGISRKSANKVSQGLQALINVECHPLFSITRHNGAASRLAGSGVKLDYPNLSAVEHPLEPNTPKLSVKLLANLGNFRDHIFRHDLRRSRSEHEPFTRTRRALNDELTVRSFNRSTGVNRCY